MPLRTFALVVLMALLTACASPPPEPTIELPPELAALASVEPYRYDGPITLTLEPTEVGPFPLCEKLIPSIYREAIDIDTENYCHVCTTRGEQGACEEGMAVYLFREYSKPDDTLKQSVADNANCAQLEVQPIHIEDGLFTSTKNAYECHSEDGLKQLFFASGVFYVELVAVDDFPPKLVAEDILLSIGRVMNSEDCFAYKFGICIIQMK